MGELETQSWLKAYGMIGSFSRLPHSPNWRALLPHSGQTMLS
ncbi:hypothetical protein Hdeb2414_s0092g00788851 [Helianthus debilis subsp. tardiflorus]